VKAERDKTRRPWDCWWHHGALWLLVLFVPVMMALSPTVGGLALMYLVAALLGVVSACIWNSVKPEELSKFARVVLTTAAGVAALLLAAHLLWCVLSAAFPMSEWRREMQQRAWGDNQDVRRALMEDIRSHAAGRVGHPPYPSLIVGDVAAVLRRSSPPVTVRYAVAVIGGRVWIAEMPPQSLSLRCVMHEDGGVSRGGDEALVTAIWHQALRDSTTVARLPGGTAAADGQPAKVWPSHTEASP
jgi:hypothetical protein